MHRLPLPLLICAAHLPLGSAWADSALIETVVVTSNREATPKRQLAESVSVLDRATIDNVAPSHPAELLNRLPGVHINNLGGEGHMTAIRQPLSTAGVYLFLEDGIPTRPTGFFNHNGLYEVNMPQADAVEVVRGPGSALYGSDAIGGIINTLTAAPPSEGREAQADLEAGADGWQRLLARAGGGDGEGNGLLISANSTASDGYRDRADYDRQSANLRWDLAPRADLHAKTILAWSQIDQSGVSPLGRDDYRHHPERNYYHDDIGRREVYALRASSEWRFDLDAQQQLSLTPYYRDNRMDLIPFWQLSYDPVDYTTSFHSYGLLGKYRIALPAIDGEFISGVDLDNTPSDYREDQLLMTKSGKDYLDYRYTGRRNYDYDVTQRSVSPYAQLEWALVDDLRASLGARYDRFEVDYQDNLSASVPEVIGFKRWLRPGDQTRHYDQFSPKYGLIYDLAAEHQLYANYRHAFRIPTAGQLFRSGGSVNTDQLEPVKSRSSEIGARGLLGGWRYEAALYHMLTQDDIVTYIEGNDRKTTNAGETEHNGLELSLEGELSDELGAGIAWSYTEQTYRDFQYLCSPPACAPARTLNFAGNDIAQAPRTLGNANLNYRPAALPGLRLEAELEHLGEYYTDQTNSQTYGGHNLFNLRGRYQLTEQLEFYSRLQNVTDRRYSSSTSNSVGSTELDYRPGMPRSLFVGFRYSL